LQDSLPTFPDEEAFACIERELGFALDSIYSTISPSPIAAASLGQVYKARLKYSGKLVAVKVQRPGIEDAIGLDFYLLRGLGFLINKYIDIVTSDVVALMDEFARRVFQELNYVQVHFSCPCVNLCTYILLFFSFCLQGIHRPLSNVSFMMK
jgi:predicted unusual protein kinase regulating ubiquinone biosynthesis (AarF/ABC1/UbiB family)